ncbi:formate dehydrogenase accessory sulfurtransferase FdhD [Pseudothioclava arenosa]|uniref:Sulfur carrier protein FdhD n=1 Tax=Pseudothioclava arenosa TaxID=1795308 RepID=A0A2A4CPP6_9RHOB|nr:formate dehydrogenase accessory sulfurtransferase FdhD [Pseudothioclava arenosa]PCD76064.1 sulfurtransferase FdhD [Pseudothioclava arenosa]
MSRDGPGWVQAGSYALAAEVPVALVFDGVTQAVMMATPADLPEFLLGFALTEGIIAAPAEVLRSEIVEQGAGIEARAWLAEAPGAAFRDRRRAMMGPVGCGLCGIESIEQALRAVPPVIPRALRLRPGDPGRALADLERAQEIHDRVRGCHAAGLWRPGAGLIAQAEDVGRHNALDKLAGKLAGQAGGALVMTSRLSVDLVQKAAMIGAEVLMGAGAATGLAVAEAERAGITLIGRAGSRAPEIYCHPERFDGAK